MTRLGMTAISAPWWWEGFRNLGYSAKWPMPKNSMNRPIIPRPVLGAENLVVVEWDGSSFTPLYLAERFGCQISQYEPRRNDENQIPNFVAGDRIDMLIGTVRTAQECRKFGDLVSNLQPVVTIMVSPSEVLPFESGRNLWTHHVRIDTAMLGDTLCGAWGIFILAPFRIASLSQPLGTWSPGTTTDLYKRGNQLPLADEFEPSNIRRVPNSAGKIATYIDSSGVRTLSCTSQRPIITLCDARGDTLEWPWIRQNGPPIRLLKLTLLGCHPVWFSRKQVPITEVVGAIWRIAPSSIWSAVFDEISKSRGSINLNVVPVTDSFPVTEAPHIMGAVQNSIDVRDPMDGIPEDSPCSSTNRDFRVGGGKRYKDTGVVLENVARDARGMAAINTFMKSVSSGTQRAYARGWKHWMRFCKGYGCEPWLTPGRVGRCELLVKFAMRENRVLKLHPSSISVKIAAIRFYHIMAGAQDFTVQGERYKHLLNALTKESPVSRNLPLSPDILAWFHQKFKSSWLERRFQTVWAALVMGFNFLLRGSEIINTKRDDVNLSEDDTLPYISLCIQFSKTDQAGVGVFRSLYANRSFICPFSCWGNIPFCVNSGECVVGIALSPRV